MENVNRWALAAAMTLGVLGLSSIPGNSVPPIGGWNTDKLLHFAVYSVLGAAWAWAVIGRFGRQATGVLVVSAVAVAAFGAVDECYQGFIPGRFPSVYDAMADALGAVFGTIALVWLARKLGNGDHKTLRR